MALIPISFASTLGHPVHLQDLLIMRKCESFSLTFFPPGPQNLRDNAGAQDLLIPKESEGLRKLAPKTCAISPLRRGAGQGWLCSPEHRTYLCRKNIEDLLKNFQASACEKLIGK